MFQKINLPVLLTIMCLLITAVLGLTFVNRGYVAKVFNQNKTNQTEIKVTRTDYSGIARKTLDWIDTQRGDDGWYILERGCDLNTKTCDIVWNNPEGNQDGLIATWARFNFYNQTKDPKDLDIVKQDINLFYDKYPNGVTNSLWICQITYDMYQSPLFDQSTKDKLEKICFKSRFPIVEEMSDYQTLMSSKIQNLDSRLAVWETWDGYQLTVRGIDNYFGITTDLVSKYLWSQDKTYLELAQKHLEKMKEILDQQKAFVIADNLCLAGYSSLDLYQYGGKNETDLNYTRDLFVTYINNPADKKQFQTTICGLLAKKLYSLTKGEIFLSGLESGNKVLINNLLDAENSFANKNSDYGFFKAVDGNFNVPYKNVAENGLIVELIRD